MAIGIWTSWKIESFRRNMAYCSATDEPFANTVGSDAIGDVPSLARTETASPKSIMKIPRKTAQYLWPDTRASSTHAS